MAVIVGRGSGGWMWLDVVATQGWSLLPWKYQEAPARNQALDAQRWCHVKHAPSPFAHSFRRQLWLKRDTPLGWKIHLCAAVAFNQFPTSQSGAQAMLVIDSVNEPHR